MWNLQSSRGLQGQVPRPLLWIFGDLPLVPERVPGAKHTRHRGQDSVDSPFTTKEMHKFVQTWSVQMDQLQHIARGRNLV